MRIAISCLRVFGPPVALCATGILSQRVANAMPRVKFMIGNSRE